MNTKTYLRAMTIYWLVFGLICAFFPTVMDLFQTEAGIEVGTAFSDHVWKHVGYDIFSFCIVVFALSGEKKPSRRMLWAVAIAALMPAIAIFYSLASTSYWNPLFIGAGLGCVAFAVWGFVIVRKMKGSLDI
jgi:uncharacterized membrane protein